MKKIPIKPACLIAAIVVAVILVAITLPSLFKPTAIPEEIIKPEVGDNVLHHPLTGKIWPEENFDFFPVAIMIDNAIDITPQAGLSQAPIVYEALTESQITRLLAIFSSVDELDKIGPVRSARNYFMDWAEEYQGLYVHVGGSPQALAVIDNYDFIDVNQMGADEIYFWRDSNLRAPHNVFTSDSNILRAGEMKKVATTTIDFKAWNFTDDLATTTEPINFSVNFSNDLYKIDWQWNEALNIYQRFRNNDKSIDSLGEQLKADNVIVQVVNSYLIDIERRGMDTKDGGEVFIFNQAGQQTGHWKYIDGRTVFLNEADEELKLSPGKTWLQIIDDPEKLIIQE